MHKIHDQYQVDRDIIYMMLLLLVSIILIFWYGSTIPAFESFRTGFFVILLITVWLVGMYVGKFGKHWKK
ncbi:MAG: hypothetical protein JW754_03305 [Candidatus Aenigmarchaeota archaeon]|nr:hypothetical protein [Candidatus Aenigmarchaeota archaeon]